MADIRRQVRFGKWVKVTGPLGTEYVDADVVGEIEETKGVGLVPLTGKLLSRCQNQKAWTIVYAEGWGARLATIDPPQATVWCVVQSRNEAEWYLNLLEQLNESGVIEMFPEE